MSQVTLRVNTFSGGDMGSISNYRYKRMVLNDKIKEYDFALTVVLTYQSQFPQIQVCFLLCISQNKQTTTFTFILFARNTFVLLFRYCFSCRMQSWPSIHFHADGFSQVSVEHTGHLYIFLHPPPLIQSAFLICECNLIWSHTW